DHVFLQLIAASGERFVGDEGEKPLQPIDRLKRDAAENARELVADRLVGFVRSVDGRCATGHGCMLLRASCVLSTTTIRPRSSTAITSNSSRPAGARHTRTAARRRRVARG